MRNKKEKLFKLVLILAFVSTLSFSCFAFYQEGLDSGYNKGYYKGYKEGYDWGYFDGKTYIVRTSIPQYDSLDWLIENHQIAKESHWFWVKKCAQADKQYFFGGDLQSNINWMKIYNMTIEILTSLKQSNENHQPVIPLGGEGDVASLEKP